MTNEITYEILWQITQKEKQTNELQLLPKNFYESVIQLIQTLEKRNPTDEEENTKKNTIKLVTEIFEKRKQKILIYVAYKKQLPQPAVKQEQEFYNTLIEFSNNNRFEFKTTKGGTTTLISLQTIPEIILPSGKKAGPFEKDQAIEIGTDEEDIKFLINNTICKQT